MICRIGQTPVRAGHAHKQLGRDENSFEEDTNTGERWMMIFLSEIMCTAAGWGDRDIEASPYLDDESIVAGLLGMGIISGDRLSWVSSSPISGV